MVILFLLSLCSRVNGGNFPCCNGSTNTEQTSTNNPTELRFVTPVLRRSTIGSVSEVPIQQQFSQIPDPMRQSPKEVNLETLSSQNLSNVQNELTLSQTPILKTKDSKDHKRNSNIIRIPFDESENQNNPSNNLSQKYRSNAIERFHKANLNKYIRPEKENYEISNKNYLSPEKKKRLQKNGEFYKQKYQNNEIPDVTHYKSKKSNFERCLKQIILYTICQYLNYTELQIFMHKVSSEISKMSTTFENEFWHISPLNFNELYLFFDFWFVKDSKKNNDPFIQDTLASRFKHQEKYYFYKDIKGLYIYQISRSLDYNQYVFLYLDKFHNLSIEFPFKVQFKISFQFSELQFMVQILTNNFSFLNIFGLTVEKVKKTLNDESQLIVKTFKKTTFEMNLNGLQKNGLPEELMKVLKNFKILNPEQLQIN